MEIYIFLGFGIVLAIIVALMLIKDSETNKKFARFERAIESVMQENFNLKIITDKIAASTGSKAVKIPAREEEI